MNRMPIITGSSGFIGSHLKEFIPGSIGIDKIPSKFTDIDADLSKEDIKMECSILYHLAAVADVTKAIEDPIDTYRSNIVSTMNIIENFKYDLLVFTSTVGVVEPLLNPYTLSKYICEQIIKKSYKPYIILRLANVYGNRSKSVVNKFLRNNSITIYGGEQTRDFLYIKDLIDVLLVIKDVICYPNKTLYVGTGKATSINLLVDIIEKIQEKKIKNYLPIKNHEIIDPDIETDFICNTALEEGIKRCMIKKT